MNRDYPQQCPIFRIPIAAPALHLCLLLLLTSSYACSDVRLQADPPPPPQDLDRLLTIEGQFCTEPNTQITFPVKVLYILDQSASLQCLDSENRRFEALNSSINALRSQPNTYFAFIGFSSWVRQRGFTRRREDVAEFLDPAQGLGPATDYQGSLATAILMLEQDMLETDPMELARTRYIVQFISDGVPEPRCTAGCDSSRPPDSLYGVCNTDRNIPEGEYVELVSCQPYNQPNQIVRRVEEVLALKDIYSVGNVTLNTVLLFSPQEVVESVCPGAAEQFGYDRNEAKSLLLAMAHTGNGTFRDVNLQSTTHDYLTFNVSSMPTEYGLTTLFAINENTVQTADGLLADSDGDGMPDKQELALGTNPHRVDSDGDGYTDLFEERFRRAGFDPLGSNLPAIGCSSNRDRDGDGLRDCEELYLGTDPLNPDSDGDTIPDGIEFRFGTNPLAEDTHLDPDFDGIANIDEIRGGTNPLEPDGDVYRESRILYGLRDLGSLEIENPRNNRLENRRCYDSDLRRVRMATTTIPTNPGLNRIKVYSHERPVHMGAAGGILRVACFEAIYGGGRMKNPADGHFNLSQEALDQQHESYSMLITRLSQCPFFELELAPPDPNEDEEWEGKRLHIEQLEEMIRACMPSKLALDNQLYTRHEIFDLLDRHLDQDTLPRLPKAVHQLYTPLASFRASRDCIRPWESERVENLLNQMIEACGTCQVP